MRIALLWRPHVGDQRETTTAIDAEPGASRFFITTREQRNGLTPPRGGTRAARVELITIAGQHQRVVRMALPGEQGEAHDRILDFAEASDVAFSAQRSRKLRARQRVARGAISHSSAGETW